MILSDVFVLKIKWVSISNSNHYEPRIESSSMPDTRGTGERERGMRVKVLRVPTSPKNRSSPFHADKCADHRCYEHEANPTHRRLGWLQHLHEPHASTNDPERATSVKRPEPVLPNFLQLFPVSSIQGQRKL